MITVEQILPLYDSMKDLKFHGRHGTICRLLDYLHSEMLRYINHGDKDKVMEIYNLIKVRTEELDALPPLRKASWIMCSANIETGDFFKIDKSLL